MSTYKGHLTADHVLSVIGTAKFNALCEANCQPTNRVMDNGEVEFSASINHDGDTVTVYYYQDAADVEACENLDELDWYPIGFSIY